MWCFVPKTKIKLFFVFGFIGFASYVTKTNFNVPMLESRPTACLFKIFLANKKLYGSAEVSAFCPPPHNISTYTSCSY
jgi:hypothetical protein